MIKKNLFTSWLCFRGHINFFFFFVCPISQIKAIFFTTCLIMSHDVQEQFKQFVVTGPGGGIKLLLKKKSSVGIDLVFIYYYLHIPTV